MVMTTRNPVDSMMKMIHYYTSKYFVPSVMGLRNKNLYNARFKDEKTGVDGYCIKHDNIFVVLFSASNEDKDWITNFTFWKMGSFIWKLLKRKIYPYGDPKNTKVRIHGGFAEGYLSVKPVIQKAFKESGCEYIIVLGYSMGGGLAPICALDLQYNNDLSFEKIGCGHSGPKVFNKEGKRSYDLRVPCTARYKYGNDIVTKVPPFIDNYHVGEYYHIGPKEKWWKLSFKDHAGYKEIALFASEKYKQM